MIRNWLHTLLSVLMTSIISLSYTLSAQKNSGETLVIYTHDQDQQIVKKIFDISQIDSICFMIEEIVTTTTFEIKDLSTTASSVTLSVLPSDSQTTYYIGVDNKAHYDETFSNDKAYLDNKIEILRTMAGVNGKSFTEYLREILNQGVVTHTEEDLYSDTEYYICIFGLDEMGRVTTPLQRYTVTTSSLAPESDMTFELVTTERTTHTLSIQITPSDSGASYYWGCLTKDQYVAYDSDENAVADIIFSAELFDDIDWSKPESTLRGVQTIAIGDLQPSTEYVLLVFGISVAGEQTTKATTLSISTIGGGVIIPESPLPFGSNKDDIAIYESSAGSTLDSDLSSSQGFEYMYVYRVNKTPFIMRIYFVSDDGAGVLNEYWAVLDSYDEIFQEDQGMISLTESFVSSLLEYGYTDPIVEEGAFLSSKGDQYDLMIMPGTGEDLGIEAERIVVLDFAPRGEFLP